MSSNNTIVVIVVEGGLVTSVHSNGDPRVIVIDKDAEVDPDGREVIIGSDLAWVTDHAIEAMDADCAAAMDHLDGVRGEVI